MRVRPDDAVVSAVVRVMWQAIRANGRPGVRTENDSGGSSPCWISSRGPIDRRPVQPRRRAGLQPARGETRAARGSPPADRRRLAEPSGRRPQFAEVDHAAQKRAGGQHNRAAAKLSPSANATPRPAPLVDRMPRDLAFDDRRGRRAAISACIARR